MSCRPAVRPHGPAPEVQTVQGSRYDVVLEVDGQTRFSWELLGRAPRSGEEWVALYAALIAHGTSTEATGVARMIPGLGTERVLGMTGKLESRAALESANKAVVGLLRAQPVASVWGDGRVAASDMMSIEASKHLWRARVDPRRRTFALGVYNHVIDQRGLVHDQPILLDERQAGAAIEGAIRQSAPRIERVSVVSDTSSPFLPYVAASGFFRGRPGAGCPA